VSSCTKLEQWTTTKIQVNCNTKTLATPSVGCFSQGRVRCGEYWLRNVLQSVAEFLVFCLWYSLYSKPRERMPCTHPPADRSDRLRLHAEGCRTDGEIIHAKDRRAGVSKIGSRKKNLPCSAREELEKSDYPTLFAFSARSLVAQKTWR
jgi:hypothetical protein